MRIGMLHMLPGDLHHSDNDLVLLSSCYGVYQPISET